MSISIYLRINYEASHVYIRSNGHKIQYAGVWRGKVIRGMVEGNSDRGELSGKGGMAATIWRMYVGM